MVSWFVNDGEPRAAFVFCCMAFKVLPPYLTGACQRGKSSLIGAAFGIFGSVKRESLAF